MSCPICDQRGCSCSDTAVEVCLLKEMLEQKLDRLIALIEEERSERKAEKAREEDYRAYQLKVHYEREALIAKAKRDMGISEEESK